MSQSYYDKYPALRQYYEADPTPEILAFHASEIARWRRRYPQMFSAPQPKPLPRFIGKAKLSMKEEFNALAKQLEDGTFQLRTPAASTDGLLRVESIGTCLDPVIRHGDVYWIDTSLEPEHGDFVVVAITPPMCEKYNAHRDNPAAHPSVRGLVSPVLCKQLRSFAGHWLLCWNKGHMPFEGSRVLGVVRRIDRGAATFGAGVAVKPFAAHCAALPSHVVHSDSASGVSITQLYTTPSEAIQTVAEVTITAPEACTWVASVMMTFTHDMEDPVFEAMAYDLLRVGTSVSYKSIYSARSSSTTKDSFSTSATFPVSAGTHTIRFGLAKLAPGTTLTVDSCQLNVVEAY